MTNSSKLTNHPKQLTCKEMNNHNKLTFLEPYTKSLSKNKRVKEGGEKDEKLKPQCLSVSTSDSQPR